MKQSERPRTIVVAGMPRSGSTWLYNAARLILLARNPDLNAAWVEDYDPTDPGTVHLVKVHNPEHLTFEADLILTTWRPLETAVASLVRMGWHKGTPEGLARAYQRQLLLYRYWRVRSDLETDYDDITDRSDVAVGRLMHLLTGTQEPDAARAIAKTLSEARAPTSGTYDKTTLLHPGHRSDPDAEAPVTPETVIETLVSISPE